jgi:hypothetical protein
LHLDAQTSFQLVDQLLGKINTPGDDGQDYAASMALAYFTDPRILPTLQHLLDDPKSQYMALLSLSAQHDPATPFLLMECI